jgi:hypothetical protein
MYIPFLSLGALTQMKIGSAVLQSVCTKLQISMAEDKIENLHLDVIPSMGPFIINQT